MFENIARRASSSRRARVQRVEPLGQLVERPPDVAQLVGPPQPGAHRAVAGLDARTVSSSRAGIPTERRRGRRARARWRTRPSRPARRRPRAAVGVEHHQPGQHHGGDRADGQRAERDDEQQVAQRPGAPGRRRAARARRRQLRHARQRDRADGGARVEHGRRSRLEPVAHATRRRDPARLVGVGLQLLAQPADVHRDRRRVLVLGRRVPHLAEQLAPGEDLAAASGPGRAAGRTPSASA